MKTHFDIIIIGSGIVGATAALALAKNTGLKIAVLDSQSLSTSWENNKYDHRVSAISPVSQQIFKKLNTWEKMISKRISPYLHMHVWDALGAGEVKFDCQDIQASVLGYIIEDAVVRSSLQACFLNYENINFIYPVQLVELHEKNNCIELVTKDEIIFTADLVIAADGAHSWVRDKTHIELKTADYQHTAIVATVKTELSHQKTARQCFLSTGPLAFLPLDDLYTSSIVWSVLPAQAEKLLSLTDSEFCEKLTENFVQQLGKIQEVSVRYHFPLQMRHAKNYVKSRIALIGDAAHTIHPLAGQGVNLGILDAVCLAEVIQDACEKQRDFSSFNTLRRYERWRKGDNLLMLKMVEMVKNIFMSDKKILQALRNNGLNLTDRMIFLKNFFVNSASGNRGELPSIVRDF